MKKYLREACYNCGEMDINIFEKVSLKGCIAFTIMCFENTENTEDLYSSGILSLKICSDQKKARSPKWRVCRYKLFKITEYKFTFVFINSASSITMFANYIT